MRPRVTEEPAQHSASSDGDAGRAAARLAGASVSVAVWTTVSRVTGLGRMAMVAAVLGPTYLGNTFQATNVLPNLTYEFFTGSLLIGLVVPPLVRHVDRADRGAIERLAGGLLSVVIIGFSVITLLAVAAGPILLRLLTLGVEDPAVADAQRRVGMTLLMLLFPQVVLYGIAGTCAAIINAHGRFALPAAAPALENLGVVATLAAVALLYGSDLELVAGHGGLLLLGLGTTAAVGLHAATQWLGVRHLGLRVRPRAGWRDPELRALLRGMVPSIGYAGLNSLRNFSALIVANRVPGGIVAFQLALNFYYLPIAVGVRPVAVAALPQLSRLHQGDAHRGFRDEFVRAASLAYFAAIPAAVAYVAVSGALAEAVSFGQMATSMGAPLVAASLAALGPGIVGETGLLLGTHASYAQGDARTPFLAVATRTAITLAGVAVTLVVAHGVAVLILLGTTMSLASLIGALQLTSALRRRVPAGQGRLAPALLRTLVAAALMAVPVHILAVRFPEYGAGYTGAVLRVVGAVLAGGVVYIGLHWLWGSPELRSLRRGIGGLGLRV